MHNIYSLSGDDESTLPPRKRKVSHDLVDVNGDNKANAEEPSSSSPGGCNSASSSPEKPAKVIQYINYLI